MTTRGCSRLICAWEGVHNWEIPIRHDTAGEGNQKYKKHEAAGSHGLLLSRHNLVFDPLIRGAWKNLLLHQLVFPCIRSPLDDLLGVGLANARERHELLGGGCVDVKEVRNVRGWPGWPC